MVWGTEKGDTVTIRVDPETKQQLRESVKRFFAEELDDDIGDLKAELVVDYCMREICPTVYNRAISDAQSYFQGKVEDLGDSCFEPELDYWKKS